MLFCETLVRSIIILNLIGTSNPADNSNYFNLGNIDYVKRCMQLFNQLTVANQVPTIPIPDPTAVVPKNNASKKGKKKPKKCFSPKSKISIFVYESTDCSDLFELQMMTKQNSDLILIPKRGNFSHETRIKYYYASAHQAFDRIMVVLYEFAANGGKFDGNILNSLNHLTIGKLQDLFTVEQENIDILSDIVNNSNSIDDGHDTDLIEAGIYIWYFLHECLSITFAELTKNHSYSLLDYHGTLLYTFEKMKKLFDDKLEVLNEFQYDRQLDPQKINELLLLTHSVSLYLIQLNIADIIYQWKFKDGLLRNNITVLVDNDNICGFIKILQQLYTYNYQSPIIVETYHVENIRNDCKKPMFKIQKKSVNQIPKEGVTVFEYKENMDLIPFIFATLKWLSKLQTPPSKKQFKQFKLNGHKLVDIDAFKDVEEIFIDQYSNILYGSKSALEDEIYLFQINTNNDNSKLVSMNSIVEQANVLLEYFVNGVNWDVKSFISTADNKTCLFQDNNDNEILLSWKQIQNWFLAGQQNNYNKWM